MANHPKLPNLTVLSVNEYLDQAGFPKTAREALDRVPCERKKQSNQGLIARSASIPRKKAEIGLESQSLSSTTIERTSWKTTKPTTTEQPTTPKSPTTARSSVAKFNRATYSPTTGTICTAKTSRVQKSSN